MKKTVILSLLIGLLLSVMAIQIYADQETSTAMYVKGGIIIDGSAEEKWDATEQQDITVPGDNDGEGVSGYTKIMWDEDYLYILAVVNDDTIDPDIDKESDYANGDKVCFFVSETNAKGDGYTEDGDYGVMISPWGNLSDVYLGNKRIITDMEHAETIGTNMYTVEAAIPWFTVGYEAKVGNVIGYNSTFDNDYNGDYSRESWIAWVDWQDKPYWSATKWLGNVELVEPQTEYTYPASGTEGSLVIGTVIGNETGWGDNADAGASAAFDGSPSTFFDPLGVGDGFCGIDAGESIILEKVAILSRDGWADRFNGAMIQGSNDGQTWTTLWTSSAAAGSTTEYTIITDFENNTGFSQFRYYNETNHGDVAEVEFYGTPGKVEASNESASDEGTLVEDTDMTTVSVDEGLDKKAEAPNTFDFGLTAIIVAIISLSGIVISRNKH